MKNFEYVQYDREGRGKSNISHLGIQAAKKACDFHKSFPEYQETPLNRLGNLAKHWGVSDIYVKDESYRFGLNAFKVLGGSYAIGNYIAQQLGADISKLSYEKLRSEELRKKTGDITFISATDGNHGRGVAWTANRLGQKSIIYMPKGSAIERLENIKKEGAKATITDFNYDDAVRMADTDAKKNGWVLVQDTAWEGYEDIPTWIMQGYTTLAYEMYEQLEGVKPTHIFVQAGVGSFAGAVQGFFGAVYGEERPITVIVEPNEAACLFQTAKAGDGKIHPVTGDMNTIMAGLACGEPTTVGWRVLKDYADYFVSCPDYIAAQGMRILGNPLADDNRIIAGESGAAGFGLASEIVTNERLQEWKKLLRIDENSVLLFINSEGDTDQENYRNIVWNGAWARQEE